MSTENHRADTDGEVNIAVGMDWLARHGDMLYAYALRRVRSAETAEELVQETFLGAIRSHDRFAGNSSEESWLIGILRHKLVDYYRCKNRVESLSDFSQSGSEVRVDLSSHQRGIDPTKSMEEDELKAVVQECIDDLPDLVRQAFEFRIIDHMDSSEVCKLLGISGNNLAARLYRARIYVRQCLTHRWS